MLIAVVTPILGYADVAVGARERIYYVMLCYTFCVSRRMRLSRTSHPTHGATGEPAMVWSWTAPKAPTSPPSAPHILGAIEPEIPSFVLSRVTLDCARLIPSLPPPHWTVSETHKRRAIAVKRHSESDAA